MLQTPWNKIKLSWIGGCHYTAILVLLHAFVLPSTVAGISPCSLTRWHNCSYGSCAHHPHTMCVHWVDPLTFHPNDMRNKWKTLFQKRTELQLQKVQRWKSDDNEHAADGKICHFVKMLTGVLKTHWTLWKQECFHRFICPQRMKVLLVTSSASGEEGWEQAVKADGWWGNDRGKQGLRVSGGAQSRRIGWEIIDYIHTSSHCHMIRFYNVC